MIRPVTLLLFLVAFQLWSSPASAQSPKRIPVVGVLTVTAGPTDPVATSFRDGLRQLGYVDGQNIKIDHRNADGRVDQLPRLAEELVRLPVDIIVVGAEPALSIVTRATTTIPIVIVSVDQDPVATGLVKSLSHPGGNVTGIVSQQSELNVKRLELLKDTVPGLTRVAVFWDPINRKEVSDIEAAAQSLGLVIQPIEVRAPYDFDSALRLSKKDKAGAIFVLFSPGFYIQRVRLGKAALGARIPIMFSGEQFVEIGGLMSYSTPVADYWGRAAYFVDRVLKGAKPSELPMEQVARFSLAINLKTAKALGITFPESILVRADKVAR
jgi:putative tryptophan/tyrosine transport system substrate-binding protein